MKWIVPPVIGCAVLALALSVAIDRELSEAMRHMEEQLEILTRIVDQMDRNLKEGLAAE